MCKKDVTILYLKGIIDGKTYNEFLKHLLIKKKDISNKLELEKYNMIRKQYTKLFKENREMLRIYRYVSLREINANNKILDQYKNNENIDQCDLYKFYDTVNAYDFDK